MSTTTESKIQVSYEFKGLAAPTQSYCFSVKTGPWSKRWNRTFDEIVKRESSKLDKLHPHKIRRVEVTLVK